MPGGSYLADPGTPGANAPTVTFNHTYPLGKGAYPPFEIGSLEPFSALLNNNQIKRGNSPLLRQ